MEDISESAALPQELSRQMEYNNPPPLHLHLPCVLQVQLVQQEISVIRQRGESLCNYCLISETFVKLVSGDWWLH